MHHSKAYNQLLSHVNATGREKDGYYPNILEEITGDNILQVYF